MTVALAGEYDLSNVEELERALAPVAEAGEVCVDLDAVEFLDCEALAVIIAVVRAAERRGAVVTLHRPRPVVRRMLELSGVAERVAVDVAT